MSYCSNCGTKLNDGDKFCHECGKQIMNKEVDSNLKRKKEYIGKVLKCSNCGAMVTESTVVCSECGFQITGKEAVSSVKTFAEELMKIESKRKGGILNMLTNSSNLVDNQKLNLIRNFPIPNTIDDIKEFIFLASVNIDVKLSKQGMMSKISNAFNSDDKETKMQKTISDAWVAKLQQAYNKALLMFPEDATFESIQQVYLDKLRELKIKEK